MFRQRAQRETDHLQHHLVVNDGRGANAGGGARHPGSFVIGRACNASLCVSFPYLSPKLTSFLCRFGFLRCGPAFQQSIMFYLPVSVEVLKHAYVAERLQRPTSLIRMLGTENMP